MSQEFLNRLLSTAESRVQGSEDGANCMICLEDLNTLNTSTGVVEWEVALPCGHAVGSSCIVTWLRTNNSCPACPATFFPAQPRQNLEHANIRIRLATLEAQSRRAAQEETTTLFWDWETIFLFIIIVGMGIYEVSGNLIEWSRRSPSAEPVYRVGCMYWQDCSFLYASSR